MKWSRKIQLGKSTKMLLGRFIVSVSGLFGSIEIAKRNLSFFDGYFRDPLVHSSVGIPCHALKSARVVRAQSLILHVPDSVASAKVRTTIIQSVFVSMINVYRRICNSKNKTMHSESATPSHVERSRTRVPICIPVPLVQPLEIGGIDNRVLALRERNQLVGWVKRLGHGVSCHTAFHRCTSNALRFGLYLTILALFAVPSFAQVSIGPWVVPQYFDNNGRPCAGCKLASFAAGTTTPQATYSDPDGTFPNTNPIILDSSGRARVYLTGSAYKLVLSDASSNQIWSVDEVVSTNNGLLTSNNTWLGTQTFQATTNFNGQANFNVGFTSLGPNTLGGGGSISGTYSGSPTLSGTWNFQGATFAGEVDAQNIVISGQLFSTNTTMPPFVVMSNQLVTNLNANLLEGADWPSPGTIGTTAPNIGVFTQLQANTSFKLNGSTALTSVQGTGDVKLLSAGTFSGATGTGLCKDANGGATTAGCSTSGFSQIQSSNNVSPCTTGSASYDSCNNTIIWATSFADNSYLVTCSGIGPVDGANPTPGRAYTQIISHSTSSVTVATVTTGSAAVSWAEIDCTGVHP